MNRKNFLGSLTTLAAGSIIAPPVIRAADPERDVFKTPPYLKKGDTIGITSPAGTITLEEMLPSLAVIESWGFKTKVGNAIGRRDFTRGGTDAERAEDLQEMLDDPSIKAIMCARGGYGAVRIVDQLNWTKFRQHPKWLIGFSDITVLINHVHSKCSVAAIHSKMTNSFPDDWSTADALQVETILSIRDALEGRKLNYSIPFSEYNRPGSGRGLLVGGNLKTIESLAGTPSDINTAGKILFLEDAGEYLYSIDRMFWNLKRTGKLKKLAGLVIGGFRIKPDDPGEEFGLTLNEIVMEKVRDFKYPVCFDFPVGHQKNNFALKCGLLHKLDVTTEKASLTELK